MAGILGLMKHGEDGSETRVLLVAEDAAAGGCIDRPFILRGRLGEGDVIGRSREPMHKTVLSAGGGGAPKRLPNVVDG